jgi:putative ABC transport system permease protein
MLASIRAFLWRVRHLVRRTTVETGLDAELEFHLQMEMAENLRQGMAPAEARRRALVSLGGMTQTKEVYRETLTIRWAAEFCQDLRYGCRLLARTPRFTAVAVLTLALGIGANTAIFSAVHGVLLLPLPYPDASRLVTLKRQQIAYYITPSQLDAIKRQCSALELVATHTHESVLITGGKLPKRTEAARVSSDFFSLLGVPPALGRSILREDTQSGSDRVVVLSHGLWMNDFGGDPGIVGRTISLDHSPYTVIGVMPREFGVGIDWSYRSTARADDGMWLPRVPVSPDAEDEGSPTAIGRLKPGATLAQLNVQLQPLSDRFATTYRRGEAEQLKLSARSLELGLNPSVRIALLILWSAAGFVLLMTCVNVTALLVTRAWTRQRELAIRKALGASRSRLLRQLSTESLLLAAAGGTLGLLFSVWGIRLLRAVAPPFTPRLDRIVIDGGVLWFTMGLSLLVAVLVGLAPAWRASSERTGRPAEAGFSGSFAATTMRRPDRLRSALVVLEVLLAVVVVVGAALMGRSFYRLMGVSTGIGSTHVLTAHVGFSPRVCGGPKATAMTCQAATQTLLDGIRDLPGVQRTALGWGGPFAGGMMTGHYPGSGKVGLFVEGVEGDHLGSTGWIVARHVTPGYFAALGMKLLKGRDFTPGERTSPVAIVSERFARRYLAGNPIGRRFSTQQADNGRQSWLEIIGVVNDVRDHALEERAGEVYYRPSLMASASALDIAVQTATDPMPLVPSIVRLVHSVDQDAPIDGIKTVEQMVSESAAEPRFLTALVGSFGVLGLVLAIIGVYGVISHTVVQQTHEIGVRMALGAERRHVLVMVLRQGMVLAMSGVAGGIAAALGVTRVLRSVLFEIQPTDPATFAGVAALLAVAALAACYIPARRATTTNPVDALRHE